ncbi:MAG: response regulator transcription factor [Acidobacteriia bacterium]|nr:response regulator transcription factor [Terriglobia bacterium]
MTKTAVVVADDHPVVRVGVRAILNAQADFEVVAEAGDGQEAIEQLNQHKPEILLLDLSMPNLPGLETLRELTRQSLSIKTVLLTGKISQKEILEALQLGARGVVMKEEVSSDLVTCLRAVANGQYWLNGKPVLNLIQVLNDLIAASTPAPKKVFGLTSRELQITALIVQGCTNKDVARECGITEETVKRHLKNIFDKIGVSSRLELAMFAVNHQLVAEAAAGQPL